MHPVEAQGLLRWDILGNRSLDVLPTCLLTLERNGATPPPGGDIDACAADPARAPHRFRKNHGLFYIESPAMRQLLLKLGVEDFEELVAASSIIRPGVAESGMMQASSPATANARNPTTSCGTGGAPRRNLRRDGVPGGCHPRGP